MRPAVMSRATVCLHSGSGEEIPVRDVTHARLHPRWPISSRAGICKHVRLFPVVGALRNAPLVHDVVETCTHVQGDLYPLYICRHSDLLYAELDGCAVSVGKPSIHVVQAFDVLWCVERRLDDGIFRHRDLDCFA